ncbi:MAG TPA: hypothetical protein VF305_02600, partial [Smithellaceae bacterium]
MKKIGKKAAVVIDGGNVSLDDIIAVARGGVSVEISKNSRFVKRMKLTQQMLMESMRKGIAVYGVT